MEKILERDICEISSQSFLDYATETIENRALADVLDGLKPVTRRILYDMYELGIGPNKPYKKSARIVGDTMGKYHPHGDSSIYGALVTSAQPFREQLPLIDGYGNFGTIDDGAAAMRYTESRLTEYGYELLEGLSENAVDFVANYDGNEKEPTVLPALMPNMLVNGDFGIAVGYAPNIPPHNYGELVDGLVYEIENPKATTKDLMKFVKGPDFPEGSIIDPATLEECYETGKGSIPMRAKIVIETLPLGKSQIIITEVPYLVSKETLISKIAKTLDNEEYKLDEVIDLTDKNGTRIAVVFDEGANLEQAIDLLCKKTQLQCNFAYNFFATYHKAPVLFSLKKYFDVFIDAKIEVLRRIYTFRLEKAKKELEKQNAIKKAIANIDEVVSILKSSKTTKTAKEKLCKVLDISEMAAQIIIDMRLSSLINTEVITINKNIKDLTMAIKNYEKILKNDNNLKMELKDRLLASKEKYASPRKTKIQKFEKMEFKVQEEEFVLQGIGNKYKKMSASYNGVKGICLKTKSSAVISSFLENGDVVRHLGNQIKETETSNIVGLCDDTLTGNIFFITSDGLVKQTNIEEYKKLVQGKYVQALKLNENQTVVACFLCNEHDEIFIETKNKYVIRFNVDEVRPTGRIAGGMKGITLGDKDIVVNGGIIVKGTPQNSYKAQKRGGKGTLLKK